MKEFKGTKGEWKMEYDNSDTHQWISIETEEDVVAKLEYSWSSSDEYEKEVKANAKLIAAAPELLEALQKITHEFESLCDEATFGDTLRESDFDLIHKAKAAINKAL